MKREYAAVGDMGRDRFFSQLHARPMREKICRPVVTTAPRKIWQADLVDMSSYSAQNAQRRYVVAALADIFALETPEVLTQTGQTRYIDALPNIVASGHEQQS